MQGCRLLPACAVAAGIFGATLLVANAPTALAASKQTAAKANATRQFTGWITSIDRTSLTVEKRGKKPQTVVFTKHAEMKTTGDLEKDKRVTVYYRDDAGQMTAHRVVVKAARGTGSGEGSGRRGSGTRGAR